jgi:hypothetical protein
MQRSVLFVLLATSGMLTRSTPAVAQQAGILKQVFSAEGAMEQPVVAPNGQWVVYRIPGPDGAGSRLWLGSTSGGKPWPLTSPGYDDVTPRWAPAGDRIVFTSTRPNRNGGSRRFAMVLDVDATTGKASGAPRQVSLEPAEGAALSFDGRWVAYTQHDTTLRVKLVPSSGGTARLAGEISGLEARSAFGGLTFDKTGSSVYITTFRRGAANEARLWRIPVKGDGQKVLVQTDHPILILPADPRYVIHYEMSHYYSMAGPGVARLTTVEGKEVGRISIPTALFANLISGGDPWGFTAQVTDSPGEIRVVGVTEGAARTIAVGSHWPEAWMPDGSAVITDRRDTEKGGFTVETVPVAGGDRRSVSVNGEVEAGGWSTAMGPYYSYRQRGPDQQAKGGSTRLFSLDVRSGESRQLSDAALPAGISGPGGFENDGPRWMYAEFSGDKLLCGRSTGDR